jgi:hypothetical protein
MLCHIAQKPVDATVAERCVPIVNHEGELCSV